MVDDESRKLEKNHGNHILIAPAITPNSRCSAAITNVIWADHFREEGTRIEGRTAIGRTTAWVLDLSLRSAEPR